jgi:hypothetical protein
MKELTVWQTKVKCRCDCDLNKMFIHVAGKVLQQCGLPVQLFRDTVQGVRRQLPRQVIILNRPAIAKIK